MSKEAMKLALDFAIMHHTDAGYTEVRYAVQSALREALAEQPAPVQQEPVAAIQEVIGCFDAAFAEGLQETLAETTDERLKDLVERRLMHALYAAQNTSPLAQRKPLMLWTEAQHERAYRNSQELHKDVKSLSAFKRVAKKIAAMYGIKESA